MNTLITVERGIRITAQATTITTISMRNKSIGNSTVPMCFQTCDASSVKRTYIQTFTS